MRQWRDSTEIDALPERVWSWLVGLADHYEQWHPDHVSAEWTHGAPNRVGSVLEAVEILGGRREKLRLQVTRLDPPRRLDYRILGAHSLLLPGGAFEVAPKNGHAVFTAIIWYRFGVAVERLLAGRTEELRDHMREEGENLKWLMETSR